MTLDEIIAGMEHENTLIGYAVKGQCTHLCSTCQLIAFRAEIEEMAKRWDDVYVLRQCADELRAKIGEGK